MPCCREQLVDQTNVLFERKLDFRSNPLLVQFFISNLGCLEFSMEKYLSRRCWRRVGGGSETGFVRKNVSELRGTT